MHEAERFKSVPAEDQPGFRERFGPRRKVGAWRLPDFEALGDLATMRDLHVDAVR